MPSTPKPDPSLFTAGEALAELPRLGTTFSDDKLDRLGTLVLDVRRGAQRTVSRFYSSHDLQLLVLADRLLVEVRLNADALRSMIRLVRRTNRDPVAFFQELLDQAVADHAADGAPRAAGGLRPRSRKPDPSRLATDKALAELRRAVPTFGDDQLYRLRCAVLPPIPPRANYRYCSQDLQLILVAHRLLWELGLTLDALRAMARIARRHGHDVTAVYQELLDQAVADHAADNAEVVTADFDQSARACALSA